jgi:hypothetical protein
MLLLLPQPILAIVVCRGICLLLLLLLLQAGTVCSVIVKGLC